MLNKNVKTEGNATLLKFQYGHHRMNRSTIQPRDSEEQDGRRLKSALHIKHHDSSIDDRHDRKLTKKESMSDFYSKNPSLSKASLTTSKHSLLNTSNANLRRKSFGYSDSTDEVTDFTFDPEEEFDFDADGKY